MSNTYSLAKRFRASLKANPPMLAPKASWPLYSSYDHGKTLGGIGYGFLKALGIYTRSSNPAFELDAFMAGFSAGAKGYKLVPSRNMKKGSAAA